MKAPNRTLDESMLVLSVETREEIYSKTDSESVKSEIINMIATLDPKTGEIRKLLPGCCPQWSKDRKKLIFATDYSSSLGWTIDYDEASQKLLPDTKTFITSDQAQSMLGLTN
jgi:hypothetical protein